MGKISDETQALVKFLSMEKKYSIRQIAKKAKISKSTVAWYLNPSKKASKKDTQRPKILSARDIRQYNSVAGCQCEFYCERTYSLQWTSDCICIVFNVL